MASGIASVSRTELAQRRQQLRRQRRVQRLQTGWRFLAICGLAGGLIWVITLPAWVIRKPQQVQIAGHQRLSPQTVRTLLPLDYPESLLRLEPQEIADQLKAKPPIADAVVTRRLLPPGLTVQIQERQPVAIAQSTPQSASGASTGLLDAEGTWMPLESFTALEQSFQKPTLIVIGDWSQYHADWSALYESVRRSPLKVSEIDWRDPSNLILKTDLGIVHFGAYNSRFDEKLQALDRMRQLPKQLDLKQIDYINIANPESPLVQTKQVKN